jgi:hypothetical protein
LHIAELLAAQPPLQSFVQTTVCIHIERGRRLLRGARRLLAGLRCKVVICDAEVAVGATLVQVFVFKKTVVEPVQPLIRFPEHYVRWCRRRVCIFLTKLDFRILLCESCLFWSSGGLRNGLRISSPLSILALSSVIRRF